MTGIEQFELLMHGVQATRRHVEYLSCPISGASGVRAQFYPHQVQNVQRILSSTRIHHLIADEVGMGKTIQALMTANALRLQAGKLRVRIVVPRTELKNQWIDEIAWRAQCIAELGSETVGHDWFDVIDDSTMSKPSETLAPEGFDLLILDEPQSLKQDTLRFVASNSADFAHLLLLTASPNLRDMRRFLELLQILEPERVERARREADGSSEHDDLDWSRGRIGDLGDKELELVYEKFEQRSAAVANGQLDTAVEPGGISAAYDSFAEYRRVRVLAETRWRYRNVLRSYRTDFPDHLPCRLLKRLVVDATAAERERMREARSYLDGFLEEHRETEHLQAAMAFLQRSSLGGQSLQNRLVRLRRGDDENEPRLARMSELCRREYADTRLDCIVDWLVRFWQDGPKRKVVVAAEDNATVEELGTELAWRIPEVGPRGGRIGLRTVLAQDKRPGEESNEHLLGSQTLQDYANSMLRAFEESEDQLLIAHNAYRQSYNLQAADALIFYALPWKPEDVDQWIGRVDRLGREFIDPERPQSRPKPVHIVTLHRRGDPTIDVQEVLDKYRVIETAIDPERGLLESISADIENRVLPIVDEANGVIKSSRYDSDDDEEAFDPIPVGRVKETAAPSGTPWTTLQAVELHRQVALREDLGPVLCQNRPLGYVTSRSEEALARWIKLLRDHKWINVSTRRGEKQLGGRRSKTFYTLGQDRSVDVRLDSVQDKKHPFPPFFIARGNIQRPPRTEVETGQDAEGRPQYDVLQFLSFGSRIHQDLVNTFRQAGRTSVPFGIRLYALGERHFPNGTALTRGLYLCGVGFVDPANCYSGYEAKKELLGGMSSATGALQESMRARVLAGFRAGLMADARFVRIKRPAALSCLAWRRVETENRWAECDEAVASDLLGANWSKSERPNSENLPAQSYADKLPAGCATKVRANAKLRWANEMDGFQEALAERQEMLRIELYDRLWVINAAVSEIEAEVHRRNQEPTDANLQAITNNFRPRLKRLEEEHGLTARSYEMRINLLSNSLRHIQSPEDSSVELQCTAVIELEYDPVPLTSGTADEAEKNNGSSESADNA